MIDWGTEVRFGIIIRDEVYKQKIQISLYDGLNIKNIF